MKKQKKKFSRPRRPFDKARIEEENLLREKYGLKNKKEIWKADAAIGRIRNLAKQLITASEEEKKAFVERLQKKGFMVESIADALALDKEDWLKRRLQTIVFAKGLANTPKQARQFITHKNVKIGNQTVNIPSYQVSLEEEALVKTDVVLKDKKQKTKVEEIKQEVLEKEQAFGKTLTKTEEELTEPADESVEKPEEIKQEVEASPITS
jgi:small subunit ribosomal protein S4